MLAGLLALAAIAILYLLRAMLKDPELSEPARWFPLFLTIFIAAYLANLGASMAFLDASMEITHRYLSPALITFWLLVGILLYWRLSPIRIGARVRFAAILLVAGLLGWIALRTLQYVRDPGYVFGYTDSRVESGTIEAIKKLDPRATIITNDRERVYILTGRSAYSIPLGIYHFTQDPREDIAAQLLTYRDRLARGAVLALFDNYLLVQTSPTAGTLVDGLVLLEDEDDGSLYVDPAAWPEGLPSEG